MKINELKQTVKQNALKDINNLPKFLAVEEVPNSPHIRITNVMTDTQVEVPFCSARDVINALTVLFGRKA